MDIEKAKEICKEIIKTNMFNRHTDAYAIETVLNDLEKKDKVINEMATTLSAVCTGLSVIREQFERKYCEFINSDEDCCWKTDKECKDCIKEYFTNKAENVGE